MNLDFGKVDAYYPGRGFGFITRTFSNANNGHVFFHIKTIKQLNRAAEKILGLEYQTGALYFWYKIGMTAKGEQVAQALDVRDLKDHDKLVIKKIISALYNDISAALYDEIEAAAEDLFNANEISDLVAGRRKLEAEEKEKEHQCVGDDNFWIISDQCKIEEDEFRQLLAEISPYGFTKSKDVSNFICANQLGRKYRNISGVLEMESDRSTWSFNGGLSPKIYARLCRELGLASQGSCARPRAFTPYRAVIKSV